MSQSTAEIRLATGEEGSSTQSKVNPYIETANGMPYFLYECGYDETVITPENIASSLSKQCRFNGHSSKFYSVAEHCYLASLIAPEGLELEVLLHDASEAFICDIPSPFKKFIDNYSELEKDATRRIAKVLGFEENYVDNLIIHDIDVAMVMMEARYLMPSRGEDWGYTSSIDAEKELVHLNPLRKFELGLTPEDAYEKFIGRYYYLKGERNGLARHS